MTDLSPYPGGDIVAAGLADLRLGLRSENALLVMIGADRLRDLGFQVLELPGVDKPYEHVFYSMIEGRKERGAHSEYNALLRRLLSFLEAYGARRSR